jgi:hypothetical protein
MSVQAARRALLELFAAADLAVVAIHAELDMMPSFADGRDVDGRVVQLVGAHALRARPGGQDYVQEVLGGLARGWAIPGVTRSSWRRYPPTERAPRTARRDQRGDWTASPPPVYYPPDRTGDEQLVQRLHEAAHREGPDASLLLQTALSVISGEKYAPPPRLEPRLRAGEPWGSVTSLARLDRPALLHDPKNGERTYQRQLARRSESPPRSGEDRGRSVQACRRR